MLKNARYLLSTLTEFPLLKDPRGQLLPEIALAGRSNVGKSSLVNHLLGTKKLAKTSATPGKTQLLNFFSIDERFLFVDLPGYGFAKAPKETVQTWSQSIDAYLNGRSTLRLILLLLDSRRDLSEEDLSLIQWSKAKQIPLLVILTKSDKLSSSQIESQIQKVSQLLQCEVIPYTIKNSASRHLLVKRIEQFV